jgi:hypothetical protein
VAHLPEMLVGLAVPERLLRLVELQRPMQVAVVAAGILTIRAALAVRVVEVAVVEDLEPILGLPEETDYQILAAVVAEPAGLAL